MDKQKIKEAIETIEELRYLMYTIDSSAIPHLTMAIEALEKQLPKKPIVVSNSLYNKYQCPRCNDYICNGEPICLKCKQPIDWSE